MPDFIGRRRCTSANLLGQEVGYFIHVAKRLEYISEEIAEELTSEVRQVAAPLSGLIASYDKRPTRIYKPSKPADRAKQ